MRDSDGVRAHHWVAHHRVTLSFRLAVPLHPISSLPSLFSHTTPHMAFESSTAAGHGACPLRQAPQTRACTSPPSSPAAPKLKRGIDDYVSCNLVLLRASASSSAAPQPRRPQRRRCCYGVAALLPPARSGATTGEERCFLRCRAVIPPVRAGTASQRRWCYHQRGRVL